MNRHKLWSIGVIGIHNQHTLGVTIPKVNVKWGTAIPGPWSHALPGVDIPDCGVAIIVSGNATRREYIQRLGRVLRPKETRATLYELVTEGTTEERVADRRRTRA